MKTQDFYYHLPQELIAQTPADPRDSSRMMILDRKISKTAHRRFYDLPTYLKSGDVLVLNNTKVIPVRLMGIRRKTGGKVELLLLEEKESECRDAAGRYISVWKSMMKTRGHPENGENIEICSGLEGTVLGHDDGFPLISFMAVGRSLAEYLEAVGQTPLPPYIKRARGPDLGSADRLRYQTVYAGPAGAVAAPTAGLHFSEEMMQAIKAKGVEIAALTLHVGIGTFLPVKTAHLEDHIMHEERYVISRECADMVNRAKKEKRRIIAVGTTSVRALESAVDTEGFICSGQNSTALFIQPPYDYKVVNVLLTNFHLPCSTLLVMVSAFAGRSTVLNAYSEAIEEHYRFYSYGDCMLIV